MIDGETKAEVIRRLNRVEGQVRGLKQMVEDERYCVDVLTQIASVHEALRSVGKVITSNHLATCVTEGLRGSDDETSERLRNELLDMMYKLAR
jgi:CsoR family transcriptional regulator, copper-sensing transcriptional repressor